MLRLKTQKNHFRDKNHLFLILSDEQNFQTDKNTAKA